MKKIIITGVSEGLGYELAKLYLEHDFQVIGLSRNKPNLDIIHLKTDLSNEIEIKDTIEIIKAKYQDFSYLINCAGILSIDKLGEIDYKKAEELLKVNTLAPIILCSELFKNIKNNEADIVNISSTVGLKAYGDQCVYGASKWAMRGITENLQLEFKGTKTRVIGFNPGGFKSRIFEKATGEKIDLSDFMEAKHIAILIKQLLDLPKNMEISSITINRK